MRDDLKQWIYWAIPIVVAAGLGSALYYGRKHQQDEAPAPVQTAPPAPSAEPPTRHPLEATAEARSSEPLPELAQSDAPLQESLSEVFGQSLADFLVPKDIIRHVVVTVDNLPRKKSAVQMWPIKPTPGSLATAGRDEVTLSADNFARYAPLVSLVQNADAKQVAAVYRRYYPLFQQAYVDLGYPEGYFNDRLVEVIDHLLQTPEVPGAVKLVQPGVFYQFADPTLEGLSNGQKLLIRMGSNHAVVLKTKLREFRSEVAKPQLGN